MPSLLCPILFDDKSDTGLGLFEIFSNNASDSGSSTVPSDVDSSESEPDADGKSDDEFDMNWHRKMKRSSCH
jgi:hypothetical protein